MTSELHAQKRSAREAVSGVAGRWLADARRHGMWLDGFLTGGIVSCVAAVVVGTCKS